MGHNTRAVTAGAVVTSLSVGLLFVMPLFLPVEDFKTYLYDHYNIWLHGNPFAQLRLFGGIPGGLLAGYLAKDRFNRNNWRTGMTSGIWASILGLGIIYIAYVIFGVGYAIFIARTAPDLYLIVVLPLLVGIPLSLAHLVEGLLAGLFGNELSSVREG